MAQLNLYSFLSCNLNDKEYKFGSLSVPANKSVTAAFDELFTVAVSTTATIYDSGVNNLSAFKFALLACDYDLMLELTTNISNNIGTAYATLPLIGSGVTGSFGFPLILPGNAAYANYTGGFTGTLDVIGRMKVKNLSASQAAQVMLMLFN